MQTQAFALRGTLIWSESPRRLCCKEGHYLICRDGRVAGVFETLPEQYAHIPVRDYRDALIIPGLTDLHVHAPQYSYRGLGMDLELLEWLETHTFPEEAKYADLEYARRAYTIFADDLAAGATTSACVFATQHLPATVLLMELLEKSGVRALVGKVNMDRNSPGYYCEETHKSLSETEKWLFDTVGRFKNVSPILTPRFTPSCTDTLLEGLGDICRKAHVPIQSHLSENLSEIGWVRELCPDSTCYADTYGRYGLLGDGESTAVMAHCVYSMESEEEMRLLQEHGVFIAHCPQSNTNIASGIAPVRAFLNAGMPVGLGSDVAGGFSLSILRAMGDAVQVSKLRWRLLDQSLKPLTMAEAFYMGTRGGGAFFGQAGAFEPGWLFDVVVLNEDGLPHPQPLTPQERLERLIYLGGGRNISAKYVGGEKLPPHPFGNLT